MIDRVGSRKTFFQRAGFIIIVLVIALAFYRYVSILDSLFLGLVVALLFLPIFGFLYDRRSTATAGRGGSGMKVTVRHSRLSRGSSIGMILLGVLTLLFVSGFVGLILILVGLVMYWFYRRQTKGEARSAPGSRSKPPSP